METAKGAAWRKLGVTNAKYRDRYDQIDWGRGKRSEEIAGLHPEGSCVEEQSEDDGGVVPTADQGDSLSGLRSDV